MPSVDALDGECSIAVLKDFPLPDHVPGLCQYETGESGIGFIFRQAQLEPPVGITHCKHSVKQIPAVNFLDLKSRFLVILVINLPYNFFKQVFECDDSYQAAVLVNQRLARERDLRVSGVEVHGIDKMVWLHRSIDDSMPIFIAEEKLASARECGGSSLCVQCVW